MKNKMVKYLDGIQKPVGTQALPGVHPFLQFTTAATGIMYLNLED